MTAAPAGGAADGSAVEVAFREEWGRVVGALARAFGDLDLAEDAAQEAFAAAAATWPSAGVPDNPGAWVTTTARRRAIDRLRRESARADKQRAAVGAMAGAGGLPALEHAGEAVDDDLLRLVFTCCHPALEPLSQLALTLRLVAGLETAEIARALLQSEATVAQRLVRAKRKVRAANIPLRMPDDAELPERLAAVLAVVHLVFNEGYVSSTGDRVDRPELCAEAIHLGRALLRAMPDEPEVRGALALMLLIEARRPARVGPEGSLVLLADQDRSLWDRLLLEEGREHVRRCLRKGSPGPYQVQAAINAVHADATDMAGTDWGQILALYDQLMVLAPTPVVDLNRCVAVAEVEGPEAALARVDRLRLDRYHLWHAVRADLLGRCGRQQEAAAELERAAELTGNEAERDVLAKSGARIGQIGSS